MYDVGFTKLRIIHKNTKLEKIIEIDDFHPTDLNIICTLYENHEEFLLERI